MVTKIMPLGASNTYGMYQDPTSPGGYRGPLHKLLADQGASFDFVGLDKGGVIADAGQRLLGQAYRLVHQSGERGHPR